MGRGNRPPVGPPGDNGPPFDMGLPGWGPPPPGGWGPPPPGGWGPLLPDEWGPPPPGGWGPPPPGGWGPPPPGGWDPRGPPPPGGWEPREPPPLGWRPRGPSPPPPDWGPHPDDWLPPHPDDYRRPHPDDWRPPHPDDWRPPHPDDWRPPHPDDWRPPHPDDWRPPHPDDWRPPPDWGPPGWGPERPPEPWGPEPVPPGPLPPIPPGPLPPVPPVTLPPVPPGPPGPPPDPAAFGPVPMPPIPPPTCVPPPLGYPSYPPPCWPGGLDQLPPTPIVEEVMLNPPPDQPEWIKALISAPDAESTPGETKKPVDELAVTPAADPVAALKPKSDPSRTTRALGLLGKRTFDKPPPGRSTGIISFIGPSFGYIEREDLQKFTFSFAAFFGNPKAMAPGVRVHFTACKEKKNSLIATDVKVAPGGTENVDTEIYEAVVSQPITEPQPGERQYPGQVHVDIGPLRTNLTFDRKDSTVTLLKNDQVLINLLTDIVTEKRRATNIKPKIPSTFSYTGETREEGIIISLNDNEGIIKSDKHGELPFNVKENFSDVEFTAEDINEEVEFTVLTVRGGKQAIRMRRVKEPLLLTLSAATAAAHTVNEADNEDSFLRGNSGIRPELGVNMMLDPELYEGIVSQPIIEPTPNMQGYPGQIHANIGPRKTNVTFDHRDCGVTLLKNDHVLINLLVDVVTKKRRAANIKPKIPFTFSYTKEKRELGIITFLGPEEGIINSEEHGELPFDICENFSEIKFNTKDIHKEVEFTMAMVKSEKRAIRLMRTKRVEDQILEEQKKREEEEKRKRREEEENRKQIEEERKRREEELEEQRREAERKKREEVAAALAAAKCKWTPLGFHIRHPDTLDDISKERFQGTVLRAISKYPRKEIKTEPEENKEIKNEPEDSKEEPGAGQVLRGQVKIKVEKMDEDEKEEVEGKPEGEEGKKKEEEVVKKKQQSVEAGGGAPEKPDPEMGRLVMTIDGEQKQLTFGPNDLLSTATMLDGDKVRFNIATHQETKEERATFVEILPDSFEESIEQRRHGIVIEFSHNSGLIKCAQNPQLFFNMSEVIEKKRLELNEKVEFSVVPHETAEGGNQAIRIKRFTESVFLPVRKLGGVRANKGKMTIKLGNASEDTEKEKPEADKLKAVVKNLRTQDIKTRREYGASRRRYGRSRSKSRSPSRSRARSRSKSRSRSPPRDQFGRIVKKRRSPSPDRSRKSSRYRRSRSRERSNRSSKRRTKSHSRSRTRSRTRSRSRSRSSSRSRSRSRERSKEVATKKRSKISREREESHKRRRELSPPPRRGIVVDDELARKKRELEELNDMIAYKKSLVDPGQRTCIDYDHGRIAIPLTEYKPVRSILKKRPDGPEYLHRPYDDPYYDQSYGPYQDRRYSDRSGDPFTSRSYTDRPYGECSYSDRPYEHHPYVEPSYGGPPSAIQRYTDRYDVYDEPYDDRYHNPAYADRPYDDPYRPVKQSQSPDPRGASPSSQSGQLPVASSQPPLMNPAATSSSQPPIRPPSPTEPPPRSPSPTLKNTPHHAPPELKPPLDRFLDMLNKKVDAERKSEPVHVNDDLLPHERALQDGGGFSRIVGLAQEQPSTSLALEEKNTPVSPKRSSVERTSEEPKIKTEPYEKIQSLLRTIGLKLSTGDMSKLASRAQEKIYSPKSASTEREILSSPREELTTSRTGSIESDHIRSPSPARSSSLEPPSKSKAVLEYEGFLDQQELETLKKAQQLQCLTKTMGNTPSTTPPPGPPPSHYQHPPQPVNWPLGVTTQIPPEQSSTIPSTGTPAPLAAGQSPQRFGLPPGPPPGPPPRRPGQPPPGPPPGPPPRRPPGTPPFAPPSSHTVFSLTGQPPAAAPHNSSSPSQPSTSDVVSPSSSSPATSSPANDSQSTISTTVARCLKVIETVKSLAVQAPTKPVKSVQFSLPTVSPSASSPQTSTDMDDEIKTKQKEKLDLYNQRVLEKREQHYKDWLSRQKQSAELKNAKWTFPELQRRSSATPVSRAQSFVPEKKKEKKPTSISTPQSMPATSEPKNVWICGHSLVYWAESRAKSPEVGMQLGMDPSKVTIWWKGTQGMTWSQLLPQLHQLKVTWPNPDVLIVHLGGNDLSTDSPTDLLTSVKKDLTSMRGIFPQCILVWSNILPRRVWRHSADNHEVDLVRTTVNRRIQNIITELGGTSLTHDNIRCGTNMGLYRADGVHLSPKGIDAFNLNLQDFLEKWEMELT